MVKQYLLHVKHNRTVRIWSAAILSALSLIVVTVVAWSLHLSGETISKSTYAALDDSIEVTTVDKFLLWIHDATSGGSIVVNRGSDNPITDALTYTDSSNQTYFLVPYSYFDDAKDNFESFTFDEDNCPFVYAPNAYSPSADLTDTVYVLYNGDYYVQVQDTSNAGTPRSNIYYDVSKELADYFTLTYNGVEIKVHVVDNKGNSIPGDYSGYSMTLSAATKYLFEANDSDTTSTLIEIPTIDDYTYLGTHIQAYNGASVVSVATSGYLLTNGSGTLSRNFRFYEDGGTDSNGKYYTKDSETVYLVYKPTMHVVTKVASANSTAVNLFDYWLTTREASDYHQTADDAGINQNHPLKFHYSSNDNIGTFNKWTTRRGVLQGIVNKKLSGGFPALSGDTALGMSADDTESLNYLFDPAVENDYKKSFRNVQGLFQTDSSGYYYYSSKENFAELNEETNRFTLYEESGVAASDTNGEGMFFPFNTIDEAYELSSGESSVLNHYFGAALTTRFIHSYDGHTDASRDVATTFEFSGDDDVWIFIDDVLVADLGGIHDAATVKIDFAAGTVTIDKVYNDQNDIVKYFSDIFADTGVELEETESGATTFANNSTHTLRFFYLERGNASSNLNLKFNLTEIPDTSIYKVDQYGNRLSGAVFAVYPANDNSEYRIETAAADGTTTYDYISLENCAKADSAETAEATENSYYIDPSGGVITANVSGTVYTIAPAYVGTTDENGEMMFADADGMAYSQAELQGMFGEYFILREIDVPDGYRTVTDETLLYFDGDLLQSADPYASGVWSSPNSLVTATNSLYIADTYNDIFDKDVSQDTPIEYYDPTNGKTYGTLFAVVLKRNQTDSDTVTVDPDTVRTWTPVYGSDDEGYTEVPFGEGTEYATQLEAVLAAAQAGKAYGDVEFAYSASGMQLLLKNLPGKATRYYSYMKDHDLEFTATDPQYLIAYFYTTEDSVENATVENTVRIRSHGGTVTTTTAEGEEVTIEYDPFTTLWGSDIEVPNIENRLFFQKLNEEGELVEDAVFALYEVVEGSSTVTLPSGTGTTKYYYYPATAADGSTAYVRLFADGAATVYTGYSESFDGTYTIASGNTQENGYITDEGAGTITVTANNTTYAVAPAQNAEGASLVGYTHDKCKWFSESNTGHFIKLTSGYYILKEISAPAGYEINAEEIKVLVSDNAVYANAGTTDNGVSVGNGVGYLSRTLDVFAYEGVIDETLTWVFSTLRVNLNNYSFSDISINNTLAYVMQDTGEADGYGSSTTDDLSNAMVTYLKYVESTDENSMFDYAPNDDQNARKDNLGTNGFTTLDGEGTLRLYTTAGWSALEVYQDHSYGSAHTLSTTNYEDISGQNLTNLFSNSTFVQVTDEYSVGNLEISKTVLPDTNESFSFTLSVTEKDGMVTALDDTYYYQIYNVTENDDGTQTRTPVEAAGDITVTDENGDTVTYSGKIEKTDGVLTGDFTLSNGQIAVIIGLPYGAGYSVKETLSGSDPPYSAEVLVNGAEGETTVDDTDNSRTIANTGTLIWRTDADENVYNVDYTNALLPLVKILKVGVKTGDEENKTPLSGAAFVMYRVTDGTNYYYKDGEWVALEEGKTEEDYAVTTGENGELLFANMDVDGAYFLKELSSPDGYRPLTEEIKVVVENGVITSPAVGDSTDAYEATEILYDATQLNMNVINTGSFELPAAGGAGTVMLTVGGLLMITVAIVFGCGLRLKRTGGRK